MDEQPGGIKLEFDLALSMGVLITLGIVITSIAIKFGEPKTLVFCGVDEANFLQILLKENKILGSFQTMENCETKYLSAENFIYVILDSPYSNQDPTFKRVWEKLIKSKKEFYLYNSKISNEVLDLQSKGEPQTFFKKLSP